MDCFYDFILKYKIIYTFTGLHILKMSAIRIRLQACWREDIRRKTSLPSEKKIRGR
jgi:hypothetical protein